MRKSINQKSSLNELFNTEARKPFFIESSARKMGYKIISGVDEVGRGALAGPVLAAAITLPDDLSLIPEGIKDSKKLTKPKREELFTQIIKCSLSVGIGIVDNTEIDKTSILKSSLKAMAKAVKALDPLPSLVLIDGRDKIPFEIPQRTLINGDDYCLTISAASIIAKVIRDKMMESYHNLYPEYGFNRNMGYGTKLHLAALKKIGHTLIHRCTYRGVK